MTIKSLLATLFVFFMAVVPSDGQEKRMTPELLWKLGRLGNPTLSADGNHVAYIVRRYDLAENSGKSTVYLKDLKSGKRKALLTDWSSISGLQFVKSPFG